VQVTIRAHGKRQIDRARLRKVARVVMAAEGCHPETELSIAFGDDAWIRELNETYKQKRTATDVLAFPQEATPEGEPPLLGDIAISVETAERQAAELGHSLSRELEILLTHGILHLTGWRDDTAARRRRMMARTEELLAGAERESGR
jgi:probable rRNA maturation factor